MTAEPRLSVIVPTYREGARLEGLIAALAAQTLAPGEFEVILIDNDPDGPEPLPPLPPLAFKAQVVACRARGSYAARNAGVAQATGRSLVFTDADCLPTPAWLAAMDAALLAHQGLILAGEVLIDPGPAPNDWAIFDAVRGMPQQAFVGRGYGVTANLAVGRALFLRLQGFDSTRLSGGDAEFCRRTGRNGVPIRFVPGAVVHHPARDSQEALVTKARRIKGGQVAAGPLAHRMAWTLRSLMPPLREMLAYGLSDHPAAWRLTACRVRLRLWGVELAEIWRLLVRRADPERR